MKSAPKKSSSAKKTQHKPPVLTEPQIEGLGIETLGTGSKSRPGRSIWIARIAVLLIVIAVLAVAIYYFLQYQKAQQLLKNPALGAEQEAKTLLEKVDKLILLPSGEVPTIATVSDVTLLKPQAFFANAANGDKVLVYQKARKAVLYRPSLNKIIEFGPISLGSAGQTSASPSAAVTPAAVKIALYNGTKTVGLASTVEKSLKSSAPHVAVVSKRNARKSDYTKTLVVDLEGTNVAEAKSIALLVNGEVGKLPEGEDATSSAELLVILGR